MSEIMEEIELKIHHYNNSNGTNKGKIVKFLTLKNRPLVAGDLAVHSVFGLCYIYKELDGKLSFKSPHVSGGCITSNNVEFNTKLSKVIKTSEAYFNLPLID